MEKIAEILYQVYKEKYDKVYIEPDKYSETTSKLIKSLNTEQFLIFAELETLQYYYVVMHEKQAIQFMLELLHPKED